MNQFLILFLAIVFIIVAISKFKIHPFITLLVTAVLVGFLMDLDHVEIISLVNKGFGNTLASIGIIIAFGTIIGMFLEKTGATKAMANFMLKLFKESKSPLAINMTGLLVSIPVFCDSGFIILSSLNRALSKKTGIPLVVFVVALSTGLLVSHVFIPPTPGPLAAAAALKADLGLVILVGLLLAIPIAYVGYLWARYCGKRLIVEEKEIEINEENIEASKKPIIKIYAPIFVPIILISLRSIASYPTLPFGEGQIVEAMSFIGHPMIALFIGMIMSTFLVDKKKVSNDWTNWIADALKQAGIIILITGAGGAFGNVLRAGDLGTLIGSTFSDLQIGIFLPFLLAAILKTAQGSSTVAIITSATIIAPLLGQLGLDSEISRVLVVMAIGAGAMTVSHINDSYFWVVSQFSGMDTKTTLKSHTMATLVQGFTAIILLSIAQLIIV
jgi:gluconate:H+ symporter, GntP family